MLQSTTWFPLFCSTWGQFNPTKKWTLHCLLFKAAPLQFFLTQPTKRLSEFLTSKSKCSWAWLSKDWFAIMMAPLTGKQWTARHGTWVQRMQMASCKLAAWQNPHSLVLFHSHEAVQSSPRPFCKQSSLDIQHMFFGMKSRQTAAFCHFTHNVLSWRSA